MIEARGLPPNSMAPAAGQAVPGRLAGGVDQLRRVGDDPRVDVDGVDLPLQLEQPSGVSTVRSSIAGPIMRSTTTISSS